MWLRALLLCSDVRFEVGGTMTLVGVFTERIIVEPGDGPLVIPRLAVYSAIAGLSGITELAWRTTLSELDRPAERPLIEGREPHDVGADEHRLVNILSPLALPGPGRYLLAMELETRYERSSIEHCFAVERAPPG
jgi:hypothetical protein